MKKLLCSLLALCMFLFSACGSETGGNSASGSSTPGAGSDPVSVSTPASEPGAEPVLDDWASTPTIEETVLYEENGIRITATALNFDPYQATLDLTIENGTDGDLTFTSGTLIYAANSINGCMVSDGYLNCDVTAGSTANESVSFTRETLMIYGIYEIADIELAIAIHDEERNSTFTGPLPIRTSLADTYAYSPDAYRDAITSRSLLSSLDLTSPWFAEETIYEQSGLVIESEALLTNQDGESLLLLEARNTSDAEITVRLSDFFINGLLVSSGGSAERINPGKERILEVGITNALDASLWDAYGIESAGSIGFSVKIMDRELNDLTEPQALTVETGEDASFDAGAGTEVYSQNGIRLVSMGLAGPTSEYSDDFNLLLLAENTAEQEASVGIEYDSLSVNGVMTDYIGDSAVMAPGTSAALIVELQGSSLEENGITDLSQIQSVELGFSVNEISQQVTIQTAG